MGWIGRRIVNRIFNDMHASGTPRRVFDIADVQDRNPVALSRCDPERHVPTSLCNLVLTIAPKMFEPRYRDAVSVRVQGAFQDCGRRYPKPEQVTFPAMARHMVLRQQPIAFHRRSTPIRRRCFGAYGVATIRDPQRPSRYQHSSYRRHPLRGPIEHNQPTRTQA